MKKIKQSIVEYGASFSNLNMEFFNYAYNEGHLLKHGDLYEDMPHYLEPYRYHLNTWPLFLNREKAAELADASIQPALLIAKMIKSLKDEKQLDFISYEISPDLLARSLETDIVSNLCGRADLYHDGESFKILELNIGTNIGGVDIAHYVPQYLNFPALKTFLSEHKSFEFRNGYSLLIINALIQMEKHKLADDSGEYTIVIRDTHTSPDLAHMFAKGYEDLATQFGYQLNVLVIQDESAIDGKDGNVFIENKRVGYLLWILDEEGKESVFDCYPECVREAYFNGKILLPENPLANILADKRNLALLHQYKEASFFNDVDRNIIESVVPWSCLMTLDTVMYKGEVVDLRHLLIDGKEKFVLKRCDGMQGEDVYVGKYLSDDAWLDAIQTSMNCSNFIAQSFIEPKNLYFQHGKQGINEFSPVWGAFFSSATYAGAWVRLMPDIEETNGVINSAQGAQETIILHEV